MQSYFNVSLNFNNLCYGDTTQFTLTDTVDSVVWDFGDAASGVNNTSTAIVPTHIFTSPGDYTVTVTA
ncbi:MAG: PKD domain-containing protein, partial [Lutibacter sp.]